MTGNTSKDIRSDLLQWLKSIIRHWVAIASGAVVAFIFLIVSIWSGGNWLRVLSLVTLFGSFVCATFLAWRNEANETAPFFFSACISGASSLIKTTPQPPDGNCGALYRGLLILFTTPINSSLGLGRLWP